MTEYGNSIMATLTKKIKSSLYISLTSSESKISSCSRILQHSIGIIIMAISNKSGPQLTLQVSPIFTSTLVQSKCTMLLTYQEPMKKMAPSLACMFGNYSLRFKLQVILYFNLKFDHSSYSKIYANYSFFCCVFINTSSSKDDLSLTIFAQIFLNKTNGQPWDQKSQTTYNLKQRE